MLLYYRDLQTSGIQSSAGLPANLSVLRVNQQAEVGTNDWQRILNFWNPVETQKNFAQRFHANASLWLVWCAGSFAGYGWTMTGGTIAPHYHPLGADDVHLFDFLVFPEHRGKNINPCLVEYILQQMALEGRTKAYIEVREWNYAQRSSLAKTRFRYLGAARKTSFFGRTIVEWSKTSDQLDLPKVHINPSDRKASDKVEVTAL